MKNIYNLLILTAGLIFFLLPFNSKAQNFSMSFGGGGIIDFNLNNGLKDDYRNYIKYKDLNFGYYAFFDATFIELGFNYTNGSLTNYTKLEDIKTSQGIGNLTKMGYSLLLKYPLNYDLYYIKSKFTIYPFMMGFDYNWGISRTNGNDSYFGDLDAKGFSQLGILMGSEVDYTLIGPLYIRGKALIRTGIGYKGSKEYAERYNGWTSIGWGFGGQLCLGYKFMYSK